MYIFFRKPSPLREFPEETSWAEEMELSSPIECYPEGGNHFGISSSSVPEVKEEKESNGSKADETSSKDGGEGKVEKAAD